jgi:hypothetical protein
MQHAFRTRSIELDMMDWDYIKRHQTEAVAYE